jgi:hypothetical protein
MYFSCQHFKCPSAKKHPDPNYHFLLEDSDFVASKNYYLFTLFQKLPEVKKLLCYDEDLIKIGKIKGRFFKCCP